MSRLDRAVAAAWWPEEPRHRRTLVVVLAAALLVRVAWVLYAAREPTGFASGDPLAYLYYGRELAAGNGYRSFVTHEPTAFYPIGYPLFIALFAWPAQHGLLPDDVPRLVGLAQAALGTATVLFVWVIARRLFGVRVALVAAGLTASWPGLVLLTGSLNLETVFIALLLGALAALVGRPPEASLSVRRLVLVGALLGLSAVVRPFSLPMVGALFVGVALSEGWRPALRATGWVALAAAVVLAPPIVRNQRELGTIALSTGMGDTLCLDHREGALGYFAFAPECLDGFADVPAADVEQVRNRENTRRALEFIRDHPATEARLILTRAHYMIDGDHDGLIAVESAGDNPFLPNGVRTALRLLADWWYWATLAMAALAVPAFLGRSRPHFGDRVLVALTAGALIAIPLELYGYTRYHVPVVPFQAMAAAITVIAGVDRLRRRSAPPP